MVSPLSLPACTDQFGAEFIRVGCDLMNFFFVYDEYTDASDEATAHRLAKIVLKAMHHPLAPSQPTTEEHVLGQMSKEQVSKSIIIISGKFWVTHHFIRRFWSRALSLVPRSSRANAPCISHFL